MIPIRDNISEIDYSVFTMLDITEHNLVSCCTVMQTAFKLTLLNVIYQLNVPSQPTNLGTTGSLRNKSKEES